MKRALKEMTVGIIGGRGGMGRFFERTFAAGGCRVLISDKDEAPLHEAAVRDCDVLVFAVPLRVAGEAVAKLQSTVRPDQILIDLSSLKSAAVNAMLATPAEVLALHPMFAPDSGTLKGRTVLVVRSRERDKTGPILELIESQGARLTETTAETHDKMMAVIQGLTHFGAIVTAAALAKLGIDVEESLAFASPVYRLRMDMVGRIMAQAPELYADIALCNPETVKVLEVLQQASAELFDAVKNGDRTAFISIFGEAAEHMGAYKQTALQESSRLIQALSNPKT